MSRTLKGSSKLMTEYVLLKMVNSLNKLTSVLRSLKLDIKVGMEYLSKTIRQQSV